MKSNRATSTFTGSTYVKFQGRKNYMDYQDFLCLDLLAGFPGHHVGWQVKFSP